MIVLCELSFLGRAHIPFNAGLLATIRAAFPREKLSFFAGAAHLEELKKEAGQPVAGTIEWQEIVPALPGTGYWKRFLRDLNILRSLSEFLTDHSASCLILTSAYPSTVLAAKLARYLGLKTHVQIILHGLSGVVGKRYRRPIRRFQDMKTALTLLGNNRMQYLVLEQPIRDMVVTSLPRLAAKIEALEHPISPSEGATDEVELTEPIGFGFLGLANKPKGFPLFVQVANGVNAKYRGRAQFHAVGHSPMCDARIIGIEVLASKPGSEQMTRADFIRRVSQLHFIVLPHETAPYTLTASGVLLDAIAWEKPVIARKIPIFEAIFKRYGDIGYLFDDDVQLSRIIEEIMEKGEKPRYRTQVRNLRSARKQRAPESLAEAYREIYGKREEA
jgi:hypothetical protein